MLHKKVQKSKGKITVILNKSEVFRPYDVTFSESLAASSLEIVCYSHMKSFAVHLMKLFAVHD